MLEIKNPANGQLIKNQETDTKESILAKYEEMRMAKRAWAKLNTHERVAKISTFKDKLSENIESLAKDLSDETGKPLQEARNEINGACYRISYFIENSEAILKSNQVNVDGNTTESLRFEPLGVICNISAWNYPFLVGVNVFIPALIAGNAVAYKPSEFATLTGLNIAKYLYESGVPTNVFTPFIGAGEVGKQLLDLPFDGYYFTGSYATGKSIAEQVSHKLVPVGLELGGKDPLYISDNLLSVDQAAASAVEGVYYNNGQSCCSVERLYVHEAVYDEFITSFKKHAENLKVGDPKSAETTQGPLTRAAHVSFLNDQVQDALDKGAELIIGGKSQGNGQYFNPTAFTNVNHQMKLMKEESFGPIIGIQKVKNDQEALELMNDTEYGLTAGIFTQDQARAKEFISELDAGNVYVNCCDRVSPYLPWSGRKNSGLGSSLSYLGVQSFVKPKGIHLRTLS